MPSPACRKKSRRIKKRIDYKKLNSQGFPECSKAHKTDTSVEMLEENNNLSPTLNAETENSILNQNPESEIQKKPLHVIWNHPSLRMLLEKRGLWSHFVNYRASKLKLVRNSERVKLLRKCKETKLIPDFLRFRIPNNGRFSNEAVFNFQYKLLKNEYFDAEKEEKIAKETVECKMKALRDVIHNKNENVPLLSSIIVSIQEVTTKERTTIQTRHKEKMSKWAQRQDKPLFDEKSTTVLLMGNVSKPPDYVMETLKLGPRNPVLTKFDDKDVLSEVDLVLEFFEKKMYQMMP